MFSFRVQFRQACRALAILAAGYSSIAIGAEEAPDLSQIVGLHVDIQLTSGKSIGDVEVVKVLPGADPKTIRSLTYKTNTKPPRQQTLGMMLVQEIVTGGVPLDVSYNKATRVLAHDPEKRRLRYEKAARVEKQLVAKRGRLWQEFSESEQAKFVEEEKQFLQQVGSSAGVPMQLIETKFFLFFTDMPLDSVGIYVQYLDEMYTKLCAAFNFPDGKNIWRGKCVVVAFAEAAQFHGFEATIMKNADSRGAQGLCHSYSSGRVVMSCYKGSSVEFFATVLVHETSHGFIHRYKSTIHVPPWMNEGISDWIAAAVVESDTEVKRRQQEAMLRVQQTNSLGGDFFSDDSQLASWQYGVASSLVELLLRIDAKKYRTLLDGVKEGLNSEDALRAAYGMSFAQLMQAYGQLAQAPNLRP